MSSHELKAAAGAAGDGCAPLGETGMASARGGPTRPLPSGLVKLNVGGHRYLTTAQTLASRGRNFLVALLENDASGKLPALRDEEGFIFIDRNGAVFGTVLEFLRTGHVFVSPPLTRQQVEVELDFYQIAAAKAALAAEGGAGQQLRDLWAPVDREVEAFLDSNWAGLYEIIRVLFSQGYRELSVRVGVRKASDCPPLSIQKELQQVTLFIRDDCPRQHLLYALAARIRSRFGFPVAIPKLGYGRSGLVVGFEAADTSAQADAPHVGVAGASLVSGAEPVKRIVN
jgi:hypothetical protein